MTDLADSYVGTFSAILPAGPLPVTGEPAEEARRKAREPRTRFTCLLPLPKEGDVIPVFGMGRGRRRKAAEPHAPADPHAPEQPGEAAGARG